MKLAIIGSGNIGSSVGSWAAKAGYEVTFSAKHEEHAQAAAQKVQAVFTLAAARARLLAATGK
jgi:predicted dinucleotide-binding enzyme